MTATTFTATLVTAPAHLRLRTTRHHTPHCRAFARHAPTTLPRTPATHALPRYCAVAAITRAAQLRTHHAHGYAYTVHHHARPAHTPARYYHTPTMTRAITRAHYHTTHRIRLLFTHHTPPLARAIYTVPLCLLPCFDSPPPPYPTPPPPPHHPQPPLQARQIRGCNLPRIWMDAGGAMPVPFGARRLLGDSPRPERDVCLGPAVGRLGWTRSRRTPAVCGRGADVAPVRALPHTHAATALHLPRLHALRARRAAARTTCYCELPLHFTHCFPTHSAPTRHTT